MPSTDPVPLTAFIQAWMAEGFQHGGDAATYSRGIELFDRWLAAHDQELREQIAKDISNRLGLRLQPDTGCTVCDIDPHNAVQRSARIARGDQDA